LVPEADQFFGQAAEDERHTAAMATVGLRTRPAGMLFTGAIVIAAINSVVGGVGRALLAAKVASLASGAALAVGITTAVVLFGLHLLYQQQRVVLRPPAQAASA
jgi:CBS domain containing-hemolysin-like protein